MFGCVFVYHPMRIEKTDRDNIRRIRIEIFYSKFCWFPEMNSDLDTFFSKWVQIFSGSLVSNNHDQE